MNRKLLNGLLVLAVAAGGVGTFTSCKDEDFKNDVLLNQLSLQAQIDAIRGVTDEAFKANLANWLNEWTRQASGYNGEDDMYFGSYDEMVQAADLMYQLYRDILDNDPSDFSPTTQEYISKLYDWMFNNKFKASEWYNLIYTMANKRATSVDVNQTINPVFGSINLPIGLKTTVLAGYKVEFNGADFNFPGDVTANQLVVTNGVQELQALNTIKTVLKPSSQLVANGAYTLGDGYGSLGSAYVNINPASIDFAASKQVQLVNSLGNVVLDAANDELEVLANTDKLTFGYTRDEAAATGVYKINATPSAKNTALKYFRVEDAKEYLSDVKAAIKNKSISNIASVAAKLYENLNHSLEAYAVKVWWEEPVYDENGEQVYEEVDGEEVPVMKENYTLSSYDLAAAAIHPLSYGTDLASAWDQTGLADKRLPIFSPIEYYLEKLQNKLHFEFDDIEGIDPVEFELKFLGPLDDEEGVGAIAIDLGDGREVYLYYSAEGVMDPDPNTLDALIKAIFDSINMGLNDQINNEIIAQLNNSIKTINDQLAEIEAKLGKFNDYIDRIKNSSKLDYADKLVEIYNKVAERVNDFLANPNHYLQVAMIYSDVQDHYHHLSGDMAYPTPVDLTGATEGDAIELLATSYTADFLVPSYMKYVAITAVNGSTADLDTYNNYEKSMLNKVLAGQTQRVPVKLDNCKNGDVLTLTYLSVDYTGYCSMRNYYLRVIK